MNTYIEEYQKNKNNYQNIKTFLIGGAKPNFLLVVAYPYKKVTRLDINSEAIVGSHFIKGVYGNDNVIDLYNESSRGIWNNNCKIQWYVVISKKYDNGKRISKKIANLLHRDSENTQIKNKFRALTTFDILTIDPEYNFVYNDDAIGLSFNTKQDFDIINELDNCSEDIDVFLSYFSSELDTKKYGNNKYSFGNYPFDYIDTKCNLTYSIDIISNDKDKCKGTSIIVGVVGPNLIQERFDKRYFKFPENIMNVLWYQPGMNDYVPWYAVLKIKYKKKYVYGFFYAECCYTGFEVTGDIRLYLSQNLRHLLKYRVSANVYNKIKSHIIKKRSLKLKDFSI